jgi:hypothetical protein
VKYVVGEQHISEWYLISVATGLARQANADGVQNIHDYHLDGELVP